MFLQVEVLANPLEEIEIDVGDDTPPDENTQLADKSKFHNFVIAIIFNSCILPWSAKKSFPLFNLGKLYPKGTTLIFLKFLNILLISNSV